MDSAKKVVIAILVLFISLVQAVGLAGAVTETASLKEIAEGIVQETDNGRMWTTVKTSRYESRGTVENYLQTLNDGKYSDWRLPTKWELREFYDIFDLKQAGDVRVQIEGNYWMVMESGESSAAAWEVGDQCEPERFFYKKQSGRIRAVRP